MDKHIGSVSGIHVEPVTLNEPFANIAARFSQNTGTVVLLSGLDMDCARYDILGTRPWMSISGVDRDLTVICGGRSKRFSEDPLLLIRDIINCCRLEQPGLPQPLAAGLMGYFSYDVKDVLEKLPRTSMDDLQLPHICLFAPSILLIHDRETAKMHLCMPIRPESDITETRRAFFDTLENPAQRPKPFRGGAWHGRSNFTRSDYMRSVEKIKAYISAGHVYQVNLSQRFEMACTGDPYELFCNLFKRNPAPFYAFVNAGDHQIVSTSPERFLKQNGTQVETRPIKGTRPRGETTEADLANRRDLEVSRKDDAELSMIVDLLRNDLGKVCAAGTVRVAHHKNVEAYENVYHLVSIVEGQLARGRDSLDLIRATLPGGSITGCPKIRAMEIIDELEPNRRHLYTGAIGYLSFHDTMDLSIAIRTATVKNDRIYFSVGGGIVYDSDPSDEYEETLHKGKTLMEMIGKKQTTSLPENMVWINGVLKPEQAANIPVTDLGVMYGYGFFETIRVVNGSPRGLDAHLSRFSRTWQALIPEAKPDLTWDEIIHQVILGNSLDSQIAAVKVMALAGKPSRQAHRNHLIVTARAYTHRLDNKKELGLNLLSYPQPRQTPLAEFKSTNYLYYYLAGQWAARQGADEALILNPDGSVSETNSANLILIKDNVLIVPQSSHVLPGVMQARVRDVVKKWGIGACVAPVTPGMLLEADHVAVTNALMGAVPVLTLDGRPVPNRPDWCDRVNRQVL